MGEYFRTEQPYDVHAHVDGHAAVAPRCKRINHKERDMIGKTTRLCLLCVGALFVGNAFANQCDANFTNEGSFFKGRTLQTHADFRNPQADVYKAVYAQVVKNGWTITTSDKEMGSITATQSVNYSEGKTVPLNIMVEKLDDSGSKVSITFKMGAGLSASADDIKKGFCTLMSTAGPEK
jgi:hypothetical protein